jgi:glyoxylase-like metal-dependent hydrolase (beta-lactamase superfamily II)
MGGARSTEAYAEALKTNREQIFTLSDDTVICPGHGPRSTVGQEKAHNSFFFRI